MDMKREIVNPYILLKEEATGMPKVKCQNAHGDAALGSRSLAAKLSLACRGNFGTDVDRPHNAIDTVSKANHDCIDKTERVARGAGWAAS